MKSVAVIHCFADFGVEPQSWSLKAKLTLNLFLFLFLATQNQVRIASRPGSHIWSHVLTDVFKMRMNRQHLHSTKRLTAEWWTIRSRSRRYFTEWSEWFFRCCCHFDCNYKQTYDQHGCWDGMDQQNCLSNSSSTKKLSLNTHWISGSSSAISGAFSLTSACTVCSLVPS